MLHFVTSYMKQNKSLKQTLESAQYGLEISFNHMLQHYMGLVEILSGLMFEVAFIVIFHISFLLCMSLG